MADKSSLLKAFNTHFFEFVGSVVELFPENQSLKHTQSQFETFKRLNPTSIIKAWKRFVVEPYQDIIDTGNIEFFFEKDYGTDLQSVANSDKIMAVIDNLREPIKLMSDTSKASAMKYLQNLSKLTDAHSKM
tara:strand:+ start:18 stop:413 length:396 start_codon:yes stop_codon:yes gene_type:complete